MGRNIQNTKKPELRFRALLDEDGTRHIELRRVVTEADLELRDGRTLHTYDTGTDDAAGR
jgi:hypothetical protein